MGQSKKSELIDKLNKALQSASLGQLINQPIVTKKISEEDLAVESQLPSKIEFSFF